MGDLLILMGYDYTEALLPKLRDSTVLMIILRSDLKFIDESNLNRIKALMYDRLIITDNPDKEILKLSKTKSISCLVTLGWRKLLDINKLSPISRLVNVHPALLPEYKGYHPVPYVLINEEKKHGITAHLIKQEVDAGDIILRREIPINRFSTVPSLQSLVSEHMPSFLEELFKNITSEALVLHPNSKEDTKVIAPRRKPEDSEVLLTDSVEDMFKKVKASDSTRFPAFVKIDGEKVFITLSRDENAKRETPFDI